MKTKLTALLLCAVLLLTACTAPPAATTTPTTAAQPETTTAPPETTAAPPETTAAPPETTSPLSDTVCSISADAVKIGNLQIPIPDGFAAEIINENSIMLKNEIRTCGVILFAADISELDEDSTRVYLPMQQENFLTKDVVRGEADTYDPLPIAGLPVSFQSYGEMYADFSSQMVLEATFTDSWYAYTIKVVEPIEDDYNDENITNVLTALIKATYTGPEARFDFVQ